MAIILKGAAFGDKKTGKTSFLDQLSGGKRSNNFVEVELTDPSTQSQITFLIEESPETSLNNTVCIFLVYSLESQNSFDSIKHKWFPKIQSKVNSGNSFVIIIGSHSDVFDKQVDTHDAEEFAATNGAFHMEISAINKRNIELTLKLMRIRAFYLLRKHPEIKDVPYDIFDSPKSPDNLNSCQAFSLDIPLPFKDFSSLQSKRNRYEEAEKKTFAESVLESSGENPKKSALSFKEEKNMSFADVGDSDEIPNLSDEFSDEKFQEIYIDTLGSPSWHQKVPPLSMLPISGNSLFPQTERSHEVSLSFLESGSSTERAHKEPLMILEIKLDKGIKNIEVFPDDTATSLAERVLGTNNQDKDHLSLVIEKAINEYISQVRTITLKKPLYKVKIAIGKNWGEIVVHEGDSLELIAKNFSETNKLSKQYEQQIFKLLVEAGEKYYS